MKQIDSADVVVIGGGIMGVTAAYYLGQKGKRVILCEARELGSGATGRCGGQILHCHGGAAAPERAMFRAMYTYENTRLLKDFQEHQSEIDLEFNQVGGLEIATSDEEFEHIKRNYEFQKKLGDKELILIDGKELLECMPTFNPKYAYGAILRPSDGNIAAYKVVHAFAQQARKRYKVEFMQFNPVKKIVEKDGVVQGVDTEKGFIKAECVLNATNAWARFLSEECDAVMPGHLTACASEPIGPTPAYNFECSCNGDYAWGGFRMKNGNLTFGAPVYPRKLASKSAGYEGYYDETVGLENMKSCGGYIAELFPSLKDIKIIRAWGGTLAFSPDGSPLVGASEELEGLYHCVSFYAGMSTGLIFGKTMAELIVDGTTPFSIEPYRPGRFKGVTYEGPEPWTNATFYDYMAEKQKENGFKIDYNKIIKVDADIPFKRDIKPGIRLWNNWDWESRYGKDMDDSLEKGETIVCE